MAWDGKYQCQRPGPDSFLQAHHWRLGALPSGQRLPPSGASETQVPSQGSEGHENPFTTFITRLPLGPAFPRTQLHLPPLPSVFKNAPNQSLPRRAWSVTEAPEVLVATAGTGHSITSAETGAETPRPAEKSQKHPHFHTQDHHPVQDPSPASILAPGPAVGRVPGGWGPGVRLGDV